MRCQVTAVHIPKQERVQGAGFGGCSRKNYAPTQTKTIQARPLTHRRAPRYDTDCHLPSEYDDQFFPCHFPL